MEIKPIMNVRFGTLSNKTSKVTNPFERNNFKGRAFTGNALPFADVFQSIKPVSQKQNKLKLLSGSVMSAMSSFKTKVSEPISEFTNNIKETFTRGVESVRSAKSVLCETGKNIKNKITQVFEFNKTPVENNTGTKILTTKQINNKASVEDLRAAWIAENIKTDEVGKAA